MKSGAERILEERLEHFKKHNWTLEKDAGINSMYQLSYVARILATPTISPSQYHGKIAGWDMKLFQYMCDKPYSERLVIAGSLLAAEYDRIKYLENAAKLETKNQKTEANGTMRVVPK